MPVAVRIDPSLVVIPVKTGIQCPTFIRRFWIPAFAGMTM